MQNLHFLCQTLIVFAKAVQFCRISFLTPLRFSRAKRLNLKPPRLKLRACYSKLIGYAALSCARFIKLINGACLKIVGICSSMLSFSAPFMDRGKVPQCPGTATKFMQHRNTFESHVSLIGGRIRAPRCQALSKRSQM